MFFCVASCSQLTIKLSIAHEDSRAVVERRLMRVNDSMYTTVTDRPANDRNKRARQRTGRAVPGPFASTSRGRRQISSHAVSKKARKVVKTAV